LNVEAFRNHWQDLYGDTPPLGHRLRQVFPNRWFRIHTLPESKRYPETPVETLEILRRHNAVLTDLLAPEKEFALVLATFSSREQPERPDAQFSLQPPEKLEWLRTDLDDETRQHFWISWQVWQSGILDDLMRHVMNDSLRFTICSVEQKCVYAPYDGGADLILERPERRDAMREQYSSWLSKHPQGL
jgi:hypothetical protein